MDELERKPLIRYTPARVGLERAGTAIGTRAQLAFQLDHARARDAVHDQADLPSMLQAIEQRGRRGMLLESAVPPGPAARALYLRRPDLGRRLSDASAATLSALPLAEPPIIFAVADGLSALAVDRHALALLDALWPLLPEADAPICLVRNGRVAIADEIGSLLGAKLSILLIGERPGLSAPDSLGVYLTSAPRVGRTDAERNCISNIRTEGLSYAEAAARVAFYVQAATQGSGTGFALKEAAGSPKLPGIG